MDFSALTTTITDLNQTLRGAAAASINRLLTIRNWLIGLYIVEYEQDGEDRASYGSALITTLSQKLSVMNMKGVQSQHCATVASFIQFILNLGALLQKKPD